MFVVSRDAMKSEKSAVEMEPGDPAPMQEVEFALILARMIDAVKADPVQLRTAVYEFARSKLNNEMSWADEGEQERIRQSLETAIKGVEDFSVRRDEKDRLPPRPSLSETGRGLRAGPLAPPDRSVAEVQVLPPVRITAGREQPETEPRSNRTSASCAFLSPAFRLVSGLMFAGIIAGVSIYSLRHDLFHIPREVVAAKPSFADRSADMSFAGTPSEALAAPQQKSPFPLPTTYGVYAVAGDALKEMDISFEPVPDKRVSVSSPINKPSNLMLPDGHVRFLIYRRDIANSAPERVEVRVVAAVKRAMVFDAKGKGHFVPVNNEWSMRSVIFPFRVKPVPESREMLLIEAEDPNFQLTPGRYALILKNQGYDFTVAGEPTDLSHCLERTDAVNGSFFTDCK